MLRSGTYDFSGKYNKYLLDIKPVKRSELIKNYRKRKLANNFLKLILLERVLNFIRNYRIQERE